MGKDLPSNFFSFLAEPLAKGNLKEVIPRLSTEWSLEFKFQIDGAANFEYCSILHVTKGFNTEMYVHMLLQKSIKEFRADMELNAFSPDLYRFDVTYGVTYHVVLHQSYVSGGVYRVSLVIDGKEVRSVLKTQARQYYNAKIYTANPGFEPCNGSISDVKLTNFL